MDKTYKNRVYCSDSFLEWLDDRFTDQIYDTYPELAGIDLSRGKKLEVLKQVVERYAIK